MVNRARQAVRAHAVDLLVSCGFALVAATFAVVVAPKVNRIVYGYDVVTSNGERLDTRNIWFDGDPQKIKAVLDDRFADKPPFARKHPLFHPVGYSVTYVLRRLGVDDSFGRVWLFAALVAAVWAALMYALLRLITKERLVAILMTLLALTSASAMFWLVIPEVFVIGSVTILAALCLAALLEKRVVPDAAYVLVSAATLSMTVTNWMLGILVVFVSRSWRHALRLTVYAFLVVSLLWVAQKVVVPNTHFFLTLSPEDRAFILPANSGGKLRVLTSFAYHTLVVPDLQVRATTEPLWTGIGTEFSFPGSGSMWGGIAAILWTALLGLGIYSLFAVKEHRVLRVVLGLAILGQLALHFMYGTETFLYSMHFLPLLLSAVGLGTHTRFRRATLGLVTALAIACAINNGQQLQRALDLVNEIAKQAQLL